jgi:prepilin-type N-terminal cleavage/methylation domain-containing protein
MNYIKTNNKWARQRGTTLIELSVVIAVILLLVGVLFIGVQAWRDGANKSACLVNLSSIQKAVRGYQNMHLLNVGDAVTFTDLTTDNYFGAIPTCPVGNIAYGLGTAGATVPATGIPYAVCASSAAGQHNPAAGKTPNW